MKLVASLLGTVLFVVAGPAMPAFDQPEPEGRVSESTRSRASDSSSWRWDLDLGLDTAYESNVFLLSDGSIDRFKENNTSDAVSGRFDDVSEADDFILSVDAALRVSGKGFRKRKLEAWLSVGYEQAVINEIRSHPRFAVGLSQRLGKGRRASIEFEYELDRFRRNYLFGTSPNPGGRISASERRYRAGTFSDAEIVARYDQRIWRRSKKRPSPIEGLGIRQVDLDVRMGYARREYDDFSNRDRDELIAGVGMAARVGKRWQVNLEYRLSSIFTSRNPEFVIIDEPDVGRDLNGDSDATDQNVPLFARVDRSRLDHTIGAEVEWEASKRVTLMAGYDFTYQDYFSNESLDLSYNGREDKRHRVSGEIEWRFAKRWAASLGASWMDETSDRRDVGDQFEETSYDRLRIFLGLSRRFF